MRRLLVGGELKRRSHQRSLSLLTAHLVMAVTLLGGGTANARTSGRPPSRNSKALPEVELRVRGVGLGSTYARVRRQLGKPRLIKREKDLDNTCTAPHRAWTLSYDGLKIKLFGSLKHDDFRVVSLEVTSVHWAVNPGINIGVSERETERRLGTPLEKKEATGDRTIRYANKGNDGFAIFHFKGDRLVLISWESALC